MIIYCPNCQPLMLNVHKCVECAADIAENDRQESLYFDEKAGIFFYLCDKCNEHVSEGTA